MAQFADGKRDGESPKTRLLTSLHQHKVSHVFGRLLPANADLVAKIMRQVPSLTVLWLTFYNIALVFRVFYNG